MLKRKLVVGLSLQVLALGLLHDRSHEIVAKRRIRRELVVPTLVLGSGSGVVDQRARNVAGSGKQLGPPKVVRHDPVRIGIGVSRRLFLDLERVCGLASLAQDARITDCKLHFAVPVLAFAKQRHDGIRSLQPDADVSQVFRRLHSLQQGITLGEPECILCWQWLGQQCPVSGDAFRIWLDAIKLYQDVSDRAVLGGRVELHLSPRHATPSWQSRQIATTRLRLGRPSGENIAGSRGEVFSV